METVLPFSERAQVWIYEHTAGDGAVESLAVVLAKRPNGLLVALPAGVIPDDELALAQEAQMDDLVGSSLSTEAPALAFVSSGFSPVPEQSLTAIVVDLSVQAVSRLAPVAPDVASQLESLSSTLPSLVKSGGAVREADRDGEADCRRTGSTAQPAFGFRDPSEICVRPSSRTARVSPQPQLPVMGQPSIAEAVAEEAKDELGLPTASAPLSQAVLEQSKALTALVAQLAGASGDLLSDSSVSAVSLSARGASQRAARLGQGGLLCGGAPRHGEANGSGLQLWRGARRVAAAGCVFPGTGRGSGASLANATWEP